MAVVERVSLCCIVLLLLGAAPAAASGGISGRVTDADSGLPLPCEVSAVTRSGDWPGSAQCDTDGAYVIAGLEPGEYTAWVEVLDQPEYYSVFYAGALSLDEAQYVVVADGQTTGGVDFKLSPGGSVAGTVRAREGGAALAEIGIQVFNVPEWNYSLFATTEENGTYLVQGIPPADFSVQAYDDDEIYLTQYWDHQRLDEEAAVLDFADGQSYEDIDFDLLAAAHIAGHVLRAADGIPIAGAFVEAHDLDWTLGSSTTTTTDGSFDVGGLFPATYRIYAEAAGFASAYLLDDEGAVATIELAEGAEYSGVEILMSAGGAIAGRLTRAADGTGVADGYVAAWSVDDSAGNSSSTDSDGSFLIDGLPAGRYMIYAEGSREDNLVPTLYTTVGGSPIVVEVVVGQTTGGVLISLLEGGIISGTVRAASDGRPLEGVDMEAFQVNGDLGTYTTTEENGSYRILGVGPDDVLVSARHPDFVRQVYAGALFNDQGTPLRVDPGETLEGIDFSLATAARVSGQVWDAETGDPITGATVMAFFDQDRELPGADTTTADDGSFSLGSVTPSRTFYLVAVDWQGRYAWQWYDGATLFAEAVPLVLEAGEELAGVEFELAEPGVITTTESELSFAGETYQEDIPAQLFSIINNGPGPVALRVWSETDWLCLDFDWEALVLEEGDSLPVTVSAWPWGLNAGRYEGLIHVADDMSGAEQQLTVELDLVDPPPRWEHDPGELWFDGEVGGPDPEAQLLWVANLGGGAVSFTVAAAPAWLEVEPRSGLLERGDDALELQLQPSIAGLSQGEYTGTLSFATSLGPQSSEVFLSVAPAPEGTPVIAAPDSLIIRLPAGAPPEKLKAMATTTFEIGNEGDGTLYWNAREENGWTSFSPSSGSIPPGEASVVVRLNVDPTGFGNGITSTFLELGSSRAQAVIELGVQLGQEVDSEASVSASQRGQLVVPVLVHADGVNDSVFVSDLWIAHRPTGKSIELDLYFVPAGADGTAEAIHTTLALASGETVSLLDVLDNWLGGAIPKGALVIQGDEIDEVETSSRTYASSKSGSYGQSIPGVTPDESTAELEGALHVAGLDRSTDPNSGFRSNLILSEVAGREVEVAVTMRDAEGAALGSTRRTVPPFSAVQLNRVFELVGHGGAVDGGRAEVAVVSGAGRVVALGSKVDNRTNDPTTLEGVPKNASVAATVVPVVAHAPGEQGTQWVSDVVVANVDTAPRTVRARYYNRSGGLAGTASRELAAGHSWILEDVVDGVFGQGTGVGSLELAGEPVGGLVVVSRTYNQGAEGSYGQGVPGFDVSEALRSGGEVKRLIALSSTARYRTNIGLTEVLGSPARVGVTLRAADGEELLGYREFALRAHEQFQTNLFDAMGLAGSNTFAATALVQVISGDGGVLVYASTVDNRTGDATTLVPPRWLGP